MKLLTARRTGTTFRYRVHLDEGRLGSDGQADPAWVSDFSWSAPTRDASETAAQFIARLTAFEANARREMRLLCQARLATLSEQTSDAVLAGEGAAF